MEKQDITDKAIAIIAQELYLNKENVTLESRLSEDLGADSLDMAELVMCFEEEFAIDIPDEDAEQIKTVQDAVDYIEKHAA